MQKFKKPRIFQLLFFFIFANVKRLEFYHFSVRSFLHTEMEPPAYYIRGRWTLNRSKFPCFRLDILPIAVRLQSRNAMVNSCYFIPDSCQKYSWYSRFGCHYLGASYISWSPKLLGICCYSTWSKFPKVAMRSVTVDLKWFSGVLIWISSIFWRERYLHISILTSHIRPKRLSYVYVTPQIWQDWVTINKQVFCRYLVRSRLCKWTTFVQFIFTFEHNLMLFE